MKKLVRVGEGLGVAIDPELLELLAISEDTPLEVKTDGEAIVIRPMLLTREERIRESARRMMAVHEETLRKLAQ